MAKRTQAPGPDDPRLAVILAKFRAAQIRIEAEEQRIARFHPGGQSRRRIERLMDALDRDVRLWLADQFTLIFATGVQYANVSMGVPVGTGSTSGILRNALSALRRDTYADLAALTQYIPIDTKRLLRDAAKEASTFHVKQGLSIPETTAKLSAYMEKNGIRFIDKIGRRWKTDRYAELVVRTKSAQAYSTGTIVRAADHGTEMFEVFDGTVSDDACASANGQVWPADRCLGNPVEHPNCRRAFGPLPFGESARGGRPGGNIERDAFRRR